MALLLSVLSTLLISSAAGAAGEDLSTAIQEMQRANYFTFVMLISMAPPDLIQGNTTFFMPDDRALSAAGMANTSVVEFLLGHSIPTTMLMEHLLLLPTGTYVPTSGTGGFPLKISNDGGEQFYLNNARLRSPNICIQGFSIRCHGIDDVMTSLGVPHPNPPPPTCHPEVPAPLPAPSPLLPAPASEGETVIPVSSPALSPADAISNQSTSPEMSGTGGIIMVVMVMLSMII